MNESDPVFSDLKKLLNEYFEEASLPIVGASGMYLKSFILASGWLLAYTILLTMGPRYYLLSIPCLFLLLLFSAGLLFCVMHDASHQTFSKNRFINNFAWKATLGILGGCSFSWHQEHVVRHHGHTNILGSDPDVYASHVIRIHPADTWYFWHRWQHFYAIPLYSLMWIHWVFNDLVNAIFNTYKLKGAKYWQFWCQIVIGLIPHVLVGLVIPYWAFQDMQVVGYAYLLFFMALSIAMAMTFVLAHVSDGQTFYLPTEPKKDWAVHQLETTADFAVDNRFVTWLLGGLNFQVEHHIFPKVCHLHYPEIQKIVKKYCQARNVPYREEKTLFGAIIRHVMHLKSLSKRPKAYEVVADLRF